MRISRLYQTQSLSAGAELQLDDRACHYLKNVLRIKIGALLTIFNGDGGEYEAEVIAIEKKRIQVKLGEWHSDDRASNFSIHLVQGIARGDKMDWILQKAVELGVAEITPLFCERSEVRLTGDRLQKRMAHWQGVIISACEQSGLNKLPILNAATKMTDWLQQPGIHPSFMLQPETKSIEFLPLAEVASVTLLVGPEGGFDESEREQAKTKGIQSYALGPRILRTETAGIAAITLMQYLKGDLR